MTSVPPPWISTTTASRIFSVARKTAGFITSAIRERNEKEPAALPLIMAFGVMKQQFKETETGTEWICPAMIAPLLPLPRRGNDSSPNATALAIGPRGDLGVAYFKIASNSVSLNACIVSVLTLPTAASSVSRWRAFVSLSALRIKTPSQAPTVQYWLSILAPALAAASTNACGASRGFPDRFRTLFGEPN